VKAKFATRFGIGLLFLSLVSEAIDSYFNSILLKQSFSFSYFFHLMLATMSFGMASIALALRLEVFTVQKELYLTGVRKNRTPIFLYISVHINATFLYFICFISLLSNLVRVQNYIMCIISSTMVQEFKNLVFLRIATPASRVALV
jgi:hypothetical protein